MDALHEYHQIKLNISKEAADEFFEICSVLMCPEIKEEVKSLTCVDNNAQFLAFYCLKHKNKFNENFIYN